jgi:hypothetical protein
MALQSSGPISINDIRRELGTSNSSLRALSAQAGKGTPDAMSEFYGYSAQTVFPFNTGFDRSSADRACTNAILDRITRVTTNNANWSASTMLWNNAGGTSVAPFGYYAEVNSQIVRYWNGAASFYVTQPCRV